VPADVIELMRRQLARLAAGDSTSLLTFGIVVALWSSSSGMKAIISTVNTAYDLQESRPWWKVRALAMGLTLALALLIVLAQTLLVFGPWLAELAAARTGVEPQLFGPSGTVLRWALALLVLVIAVDLVYHFAPAATSEFTWLTPGSIVAVSLWLAASLGFRMYLQKLGDFEATYGTLGSVIVVMLWFYLSGLAVLIGAEINSEIDLASPHRDAVRPAHGETPAIGAAAERLHQTRAAG
jgi:membrane protein